MTTKLQVYFGDYFYLYLYDLSKDVGVSAVVEPQMPTWELVSTQIGAPMESQSQIG